MFQTRFSNIGPISWTKSKYDWYQRELASTMYKFFNKKTGSGEIATSKTGENVN